MAKTRIKEWDAGEVLTATDLNAEIDNMNGTGVAFPLTENVSAAGYEVSNAKLVTLKQLNDNVVTMDNYASFAAAMTAIGSTVTTLLINSNVNVTANSTVPSTCTLWFMGQGKLTVSVAVTCTINGPIMAAPRQIFAGSGTVAFTSNYKLRTVAAEWWGAVADNATSSTVAIQAAIDSLNAANGGTVLLGAGTYLITGSGSSIGSREYGLLLKSSVELVGSSQYSTVLKVADSEDIDLINTYRTGSISKVALRNLTLDGNESNQGASPSNGFNLWAFGIDKLTIENVVSLNPASWGIRIQQCDRVHLDNILCDHSAETNSDGIHFIDTDYVTGGNIYIKSLGDDGFIIEALAADVTNYAISSLYITAQTSAVVSGKRGILLLGDVTVMTGARTIKDVYISGAVVTDCVGGGVVLNGASYANVRIDAVVDACAYGLYLDPGNATYAGTLSHCTFTVLSRNTTDSGVVSVTTNGTITDNFIDATVINPADATSAVLLRGDYWTGLLTVDYDPNGTKVSQSFGVVLYGSNSVLEVSCKDANKNLFFQGTATGNTIRLGYLSGGVTNDLELSGGATNNRFHGGYIAGTVTNSAGATVKFYNVRGYVTANNGTGSIASGATTATITHGLSVTPAAANISITFTEQGTNDYGRWWISGISSTQFTVNVSADPGASNLDFSWQATVI